jgi:hypothetical protein
MHVDTFVWEHLRVNAFVGVFIIIHTYKKEYNRICVVIFVCTYIYIYIYIFIYIHTGRDLISCGWQFTGALTLRTPSSRN